VSAPDLISADASSLDGPPPRLLLLDGHSLAYRAFFALPVENFSTSTGQHTNGVYGFTSMLINLLRDEQPTHVAVAFDVSRQTFRLTEYTEYKANRSKSPSEFTGQVSLVRRCSTRFASGRWRRTATRQTTSSPRWRPKPARKGSRCSSAPVTGTRSS
jgi:hypothetical protein